MRAFRAVIVAVICLATACGCARHTPPTGRWEGTYESADTMIAARLQIDPKGQIFVSAPDATAIAGYSADDRAALRQRLAQGLAAGWAEVDARKYVFDGRVFRKPGGIASQIEWHRATNAMTLYVYLGTQSIHVPLRPVKDFSDNPWPQ
jgi:hypothetical protein